MKKSLLGVIVFVCCFASTAFSQQSSSSSIESSIILDVKIIEVSARTIEEIEKLSQDKNKVNQLVAEGKIKIAASVQIKTLSGEANNIRLGQRVPMPKVESSGSQVQYENTGLNFEVLPKIISNNLIEVKLRLEMTGVVTGKNSTFIQRTMSQAIRLKPNEATLLTGFTQNEPLWVKQTEPGKSADDLPQGNFFVLLTARLTN
jgi:type II secretory pathway component GspD/PulD (secretin)